mgnify:CR=1 FL=1
MRALPFVIVPSLLVCLGGRGAATAEDPRHVTELLQALATLDAERARDRLVVLRRDVRDAARRKAYEDLAQHLGKVIDAALVERIATARVRGDATDLDACRAMLPPSDPLAIWLGIEVQLALDDRRLERRAAKAALAAIDTYKRQRALFGEDLGQRLRRVFASTQALSKPLGRSGAAVTSLDDAKRLATVWEAQLRDRTEAFPPAILDDATLDRRIDRAQGELSSIDAKLAAIKARLARLRAQIPTLTHRERRDAVSNRAQIEADQRRLQRDQKALERDRADAEQELRRWRGLRTRV